MAIKPEYLETFRRIWEAIRRELKESDIRVIKSREQALMKLRGQKKKMVSSLNRPEKRFVEDIEELADGWGKAGRLASLESAISHDKFAQSDFSEFIRRRKEYGEE